MQGLPLAGRPAEVRSFFSALRTISSRDARTPEVPNLQIDLYRLTAIANGKP